ncbi:conserved membrane hypothetical protein [uncultured Mycobacterium sp.]|uniref:Glycerophosphoryl diester phosphodiesterase membrane domain-containing protein n=1 Tax=uncultured Mycobacterium sp. TaxID=171292 RepID=A0A1Y5PI81_9MYCO|nr:conserved membrane hypothetical protein [uncultured Mycobacterium sp.]
MFESFKRGWSMAGASWSVLKAYPKLALFPVLSGIALIAVSAVLIIPTGVGALAGAGMNLSDKAVESIVYVALFVWYFLCTFVVVFCNAALISCALQSFAGQPPTIGSGFAAAAKRLPQILGWSLVAATVGVILQALQSLLTDKLGFFGDLLAGIFSAVWGVATYFVVPVLVTDGVGPVKAIKRSSGILRRTWGESLAGSGGLGLISFLFALPLIALIALGVMLAGGAASAGGSVASGAVAGTVVAVAVLYVLALIVVFTALGSIFRAAVYVYATTGVPPSHMDATLLQTSFRSK